MVPTLFSFYRLTLPGIRVNNLNDMKKCMWLNYLLVCVFIGLFTACSDDNDKNNDSTDDNSSVSEKEIVVKITVEAPTKSLIKLGIDGTCISKNHWNYYGYNGSVSPFLKDYKTLPFPKDWIVNWGDGTETNSTTHEYALSGTYQITLKCRELQILCLESSHTTFSLRELVLSQAVDLKYLAFINIEISKAFDLSRNKKLKFLASDNHGSTPLIDVSNNTALMCLDLNNITGQASDLDFSKNTELRYLCFSNEDNNNISSLNIKGCNELIYLKAEHISDEVANQVYRDLPQGKTWTVGDWEYSSYIDLSGYISGEGRFQHPIGDISIAEQKGWRTYQPGSY